MTEPTTAPAVRLVYCPLCLGWQMDYADAALADLDVEEARVFVETEVKAHLSECPEVLAFLAREGRDRNPARPLKARAASAVVGLLARTVERVERIAS